MMARVDMIWWLGLVGAGLAWSLLALLLYASLRRCNREDTFLAVLVGFVLGAAVWAWLWTLLGR